MAALLDRCMFVPTSGGTGTWTVSSAVTGYMTPASAGAVNGQTYHYAAESADKSQWETGLGTYTVSGTTFARTTVLYSSNSNAAVNFTNPPNVFITFLAESVPVSTPQGRLSLVSATPVMTSDQTAKGTIYYCEHTGNTCPVWDGTSMPALSFSNLSLILDSTNHLLNNVYDVFLYNVSGAATLGASPAWVNTATITVTIATPAVVSWTGHGLAEGAPVVFTTTGALPTGITAGTTYYVSKTPGANSFNISTSVANAAAGTLVATSGSQSGTHTGTNHTTTRGTGAGTTELQLKNGLWTNKNSITLYNNSVSSGSIAANKATYLGSFFCTANGQTGVAFKPSAAAGGGNNIVGLFNAYNRVRGFALSRDSTVSWTYATTTWRATNGNVNNRITYLDGLQVLNIYARATMLCETASGTYGGIAVNQDSTSATPDISANCGPTVNDQKGLSTHYSFLPLLGMHFYQAMEIKAAGGAGNITFYGAGAQSLAAEFEV
jgi:hypothetical protein